jgi:hypothetical protein
VHFAEEWNELHHLQIMESLGGDRQWIDRFLAEHAGVIYYWVIIAFYAASPSASYAFSELVEASGVLLPAVLRHPSLGCSRASGRAAPPQWPSAFPTHFPSPFPTHCL